MPAELFDRVCPKAGGVSVVFATILVGWAGYKNGQVAIEAFAEVRRTMPEARLIMFGAGHGRGESAEAFARDRSWAHGVEFAGHVTKTVLLERMCNEVDILVHPALEEAQPMALIEAMALGIPVIGGEKSGGVPWTLDEGRAGLLVDIRRPGKLAAAMLRLALDRGERDQMGRSGRDFAIRRFHISKVADAYEAIYDNLCQKQ